MEIQIFILSKDVFTDIYGDAIKRLFSVTYLGKDERGEIVKSIEIMAESSDHAMKMIKDVSNSREIYSAIEI